MQNNKQNQCRKCKGTGQITEDKQLKQCPVCEGLGFYPWIDPAFE